MDTSNRELKSCSGWSAFGLEFSTAWLYWEDVLSVGFAWGVEKAILGESVCVFFMNFTVSRNYTVIEPHDWLIESLLFIFISTLPFFRKMRLRRRMSFVFGLLIFMYKPCQWKFFISGSYNVYLLATQTRNVNQFLISCISDSVSILRKIKFET